MDYEEIQKKLNPDSEKEEEKEVIEDDDEEGGEPEQWEDPEGTGKDDILKYSGDEEEEEEEDEELIDEKKVETEEKTQEELDAEKIKEDLIQVLDGKTKYRVKGREYDLNDLTGQEILDRFSKAGRFYERMDELAQREKLLNERQGLLDRGASQVQGLMDKYGQIEGTQKEEQLPPELQPAEFDTEETKGLKSLIGNLSKEIGTLKQTQFNQQTSAGEDRLLYELDTLHKDYPLASREEVLAMKAIRPDIPTRNLMEASHDHYGGDEHFDMVLENNSEKLRELKERHIQEYLSAKAKGGKKIPRRKSSSTASKKISTKVKKVPTTFDDIEARMDEVREAAAAADDE